MKKVRVREREREGNVGGWERGGYREWKGEKYGERKTNEKLTE